MKNDIPLPTPQEIDVLYAGKTVLHTKGYTEDQMLAYGHAVRAAERERCAEICEDFARNDTMTNYGLVLAIAIRSESGNVQPLKGNNHEEITMNKSITEGTQPDEHQSRVSEHETTRRINHLELIAAIEAMLFAPDEPVILNPPDPMQERESLSCALTWKPPSL